MSPPLGQDGGDPSNQTKQIIHFSNPFNIPFSSLYLPTGIRPPFLLLPHNLDRVTVSLTAPSRINHKESVSFLEKTSKQSQRARAHRRSTSALWTMGKFIQIFQSGGNGRWGPFFKISLLTLCGSRGRWCILAVQRTIITHHTENLALIQSGNRSSQSTTTFENKRRRWLQRYCALFGICVLTKGSIKCVPEGIRCNHFWTRF